MVGYDSQQATAVWHNNSLDDTIKRGNDLGVQDFTSEKNMVVNIIMNNPTFISVPSLGKAYNNNGDDGSWKVIMRYIFFPTVVVSLIHSVSSVVI